VYEPDFKKEGFTASRVNRTSESDKGRIVEEESPEPEEVEDGKEEKEEVADFDDVDEDDDDDEEEEEEDEEDDEDEDIGGFAAEDDVVVDFCPDNDVDFPAAADGNNDVEGLW